MANPRRCAAMMGILIRGLGADHVCWGTDAIWTGSPQWQIEALRRLEIPEDMQKQYGFQPLGPADGPIKTAILGGNNWGMTLQKAIFMLEPTGIFALNVSIKHRLGEFKTKIQDRNFSA
jgi:hypothetical protein